MTQALPAHEYAPSSSPDGGPPLTVAETARELRCSKAHVHNIIHGRIEGLPRLRVLHIGRRVLIRKETLKAWIVAVEGLELRGANDNQPAAQRKVS